MPVGNGAGFYDRISNDIYCTNVMFFVEYKVTCSHYMF